MKYILAAIDGIVGVHLFPAHVSHERVFRGLKLAHPGQGVDLCSAGFYMAHAEESELVIEVWGYSESLNTESRPEDAQWIKDALTSEAAAARSIKTVEQVVERMTI